MVKLLQQAIGQRKNKSERQSYKALHDCLHFNLFWFYVLHDQTESCSCLLMIDNQTKLILI